MSAAASWLERQLFRWFEGFRKRRGLVPARTSTETQQAPPQLLLHVGCGRTTIADLAPRVFHTGSWLEVRLDADPNAFPDIVGSMVHMPAVADASVDALYSSHNIEHLYPHEVPLALAEFHRVLRADGLLVITCPDLQSVCARIAQGDLHSVAYESSAGPIAAIDMLYGHRPAMAQGNLFMAHRTGFTLDTLIDALRSSGFTEFYGVRRPAVFDLWLLAGKQARTEAQMRALADNYLPSEG